MKNRDKQSQGGYFGSAKSGNFWVGLEFGRQNSDRKIGKIGWFGHSGIFGNLLFTFLKSKFKYLFSPVNRSSSSSSSSWIASLNHKVGNDSVKDQIVVVSSSRQFCEISASIWSMIPIQLDNHLNFFNYFDHESKLTGPIDVSRCTNGGCHDFGGIPLIF